MILQDIFLVMLWLLGSLIIAMGIVMAAGFLYCMLGEFIDLVRGGYYGKK